MGISPWGSGEWRRNNVTEATTRKESIYKMKKKERMNTVVLSCVCKKKKKTFKRDEYILQ